MNCIIEYQKSPHLNIIYSGLFELNRKGVINVKFKYGCEPVIKGKAILKIRVDNRTILFDNLDGNNWIEGPEKSNLEFFQNKIDCDFYFKRSYSSILHSYSNGKKVFPLGLYYFLNYPEIDSINYPNPIEKLLRGSKFIRKLLQKSPNDFPIDYFEYPPSLLNKTSKVIYSVRLWDPKTAKSSMSREHREEMNCFRIKCVEACKEKLGENFIGGVTRDSFSEKQVPNNLLVPYNVSERKIYLELLKSSAIGIATNGLHNSIGGKLSEYVVASKAIISERLHFTAPGDFEVNKNYLEFLSEDDLLSGIDSLLSDKSRLFEMMKSNHIYYHKFLRPDILVLNAIQTVFFEINQDNS